jgi:uncharacterized protein GlcG (DUF336 family)
LENNLALWAAGNVSAGYTVTTLNPPTFNPKFGDITYAGDVASLAALQVAANYATETATSNNHTIAFSAYDASGSLKIFLRQDGVLPVAGDTSLKTGRYSYLFPVASDSFRADLDPSTGSWYTTLNTDNGLVVVPGGYPAINVNNVLTASFGVSGGVSDSALDAELAQNAAATFLKAL